MCRCNNIISFLVVVALLAGCKAPRYVFDHEKIFDDNRLAHVSELIKEDVKDSITGIKIYKAVIEEKLVEENSVSQYKLMNTYSRRKTVPVDIERFHHELYFYELRSVHEQQYGIYLAATFDMHNTCVGVGPVYVGFISEKPGLRSFVTEKKLVVQKRKGSDEVMLVPKKNSKVRLRMFYSMIKGNEPGMKIYEVIQENENKISGLHKELIYDVRQVFNDPDAFRFRLLKY